MASVQISFRQAEDFSVKIDRIEKSADGDTFRLEIDGDAQSLTIGITPDQLRKLVFAGHNALEEMHRASTHSLNERLIGPLCEECGAYGRHEAWCKGQQGRITTGVYEGTGYTPEDE